jgi:hypothetical protein
VWVGVNHGSRHYFVTPQQESAAEYDYTSPLPLALSTVGPAPTAGQSFSFYVGDNLPSDYSAGRLRSVVVSQIQSGRQRQAEVRGMRDRTVAASRHALLLAIGMSSREPCA